ncbi:MAG: hypothetical protein ACUVV5_10240 [Candidatus Aminicenantales bacterium]
MSRLKTYSLATRKSKVHIRNFAKDYRPDPSFAKFVQSLPDILAGRQFKDFVQRLKRSREKKEPILFGLGAHVIKVGLNPVVIRLMKEGWVNGLAFNGAGIIHDFEVAFCGHTSEDVGSAIRTGRFGMARETGQWLNQAIKQGAARGIGLGRAVGEMISLSQFPYKHLSLFGSAYDLGIPATVHVALGTDVIHFHPEASGEAIGQASLADFFHFCSLLEKLEAGGVFINIGSAVVLPEIFLKAVSYVRNKGFRLDRMTTAVFDFLYHYRPSQNVTGRVLQDKGRGFYFIGHHEIMIPLLAASLLA